jgi:hypothetical protein
VLFLTIIKKLLFAVNPKLRQILCVCKFEMYSGEIPRNIFLLLLCWKPDFGSSVYDVEMQCLPAKLILSWLTLSDFKVSSLTGLWICSSPLEVDGG